MTDKVSPSTAIPGRSETEKVTQEVGHSGADEHHTEAKGAHKGAARPTNSSTPQQFKGQDVASVVAIYGITAGGLSFYLR